MLGSALVATSPATAATTLVQQAADIYPDLVENENELLTALDGSELLIQLAPVTIDITAPLSITKSGTVLRGADDGSSGIRLSTSGRVVTIKRNATTATIDLVTITGGKNPTGAGGGINVERGARLTLTNSTVTGNEARDGGGINNDGSIRIENSTIDNNIAERKGGGVRDNGTDTQIVNSTFVGNRASQGGALSSTGTTNLVHTTIVRNQSTSSSSAGIDRNGGNLSVRYSIIGANTRDNGSAASDCSGTPDLLGLNLVSDSSGCNPVGPIIVAEPGVGALADNGGPTATAALDNGSAAIDQIELVAGTCESGVTLDQRGTPRPFPVLSTCDLGAFERSQLAVDAQLAVDNSKYDLGPDTVEVGLTSLGVDDILSSLVQPTSVPAEQDLRSSALRSIALRSITIEDIALRSIAPKATALRSIALRSIPLRSIALRSIALRSIALRSIALRSIALRSIPLSEVPLVDQSWEDFLKNTQFEGLPPQSITLEDLANAGVSTAGLSLESIDLSSTALRSIALRSIVLADVALRSIQVGDKQEDGDYADEWCALLGDLCAVDKLSVDEIGDADLLTIQLAGGDVDGDYVYDVPLSGLASTALRSIDVDPADGLPDVNIEATALRSIPLRSIYIENTALRSIALRSIALRSIDALKTIVDCTAFPAGCSTDASNNLTLGDVPESALIGDIGDLLDLPAELLAGLSLGDLLVAFAPPEVSPWEQLDLRDLLLQNVGEPPQTTFDYVATINVKESAANLDVKLTLPQGFALATRPGEVATFDGSAIDRTNTGLGVAEFRMNGVGVGPHTLRVPVRAGIVTGPGFTASVDVSASNGGTPVTARAEKAVTVVQAGDAGGSTAVATLNFGDLRLAHVSSNDDADLYRFTVPAADAGSGARILLSNIPDGVDYDLAVYEPGELPLRSGAPIESLSSVGEVRYDLNPIDDVYPTDLVDDVAIDVPAQFGVSGYVPRDVSSRRSDADEEVRIPSLKAGTYYVAVTSYLGSSSNLPYGLRLRIDDTDNLPECSSGPRWNAGDLPPAPLNVGATPANANTLYLTNTRWLAGEIGVDAANDVIAAAAATTGVNGVVARVVALDAVPDVASAYDAWSANRCSPDARNDVVREIGRVLDGIDGIDNVVIIGGDGVVPMAAVPDRTAYSNERTFARDILSDNGESNEVSGTLGAGYLLSDDPYAADAGYEINGADHELYVPERAIGRLVEDGPQILGQLENFVTYGGRLDPRTLPGLGDATAAVTGYDFLTDGATAVADALDPGIVDGKLDETLINQTWDRDAYLALFASGGADVISPNAHYDYESLLPAAKDGQYFEKSDLVTTDDFTGTYASRLPDRSVIFSMGCHAGLSVSDVQLGVTSLDWAELYAEGDSPWLAHTTYGYGDTEIVAYSERLAELFAGQLVELAAADGSGPASLGDAIRIAKQDYLASTLVLSPYDEKILQSFTYYGLPMYSIGSPTLAQSFASTLVEQAAGEEPPAPVSPVNYGPKQGGRTPVTVTLTADGVGGDAPSGPTHLNRVTTDDGDYYEVDGNTVTAQYRPVQPLVDSEIPADRGPAAGFLITGLTSADFNGFTPRFLRPTVDLDANERRIEPADGSFPASLQRVTTDGSGGQRLLLAAGQFEADRADDAVAGAGGRQRIFTSIRGELYERGSNADGIGPSFSDITGTVDQTDGVVFFEVDTDASARRVVVVYRELSNSQWRSLDLFESATGSSLWIGGFRPSTPDPVEFFVQAVDADGDVSISSNKVENFFTTPPAEDGDLNIELVVKSPVTEVGGYYTGPVSFTIISPTGTENLQYSIDARPFDDYDPSNTPVVSGDGGHVVYARDTSTGAQQFLYFVIDGAAPIVTADASPDVEWAQGPVDLLVDATDVGQSGVASIDYTCVPAACDGTGSITPAAGDPDAAGTIRVSETATVSVTAVDRAGNRSAEITRSIKIDTAKPTVTVSAAPAPSEADGYVSSDVTVTIDPQDVGSGIAKVDYSVNGTNETTTGSFPFTVPITADGVTTVSATAFDLAGNISTTESVTVRIDTGVPTLEYEITSDLPGDNQWQRATATVTITPDDDTGSGIASTTYRVDGGDPQTYTDPFTFADDGVYNVEATTTDKAGNPSATATFDVKVDTTAPDLPAPTAPAGYVNSDTVNVKFEPTDGGSGVDRLEYTINNGQTQQYDGTFPFDLPITEAGTNTIVATAFDAAGNRSTERTVTVKIDRTKPVATATAAPGSSGFVNQNVTVTLGATDIGGSSVARIEYTTNGGPTQQYDGTPFELSLDGTYRIVTTAYDGAGNQSVPVTLDVNIDKTAPTLTSNQSGENVWQQSATVTLTAVDSGGSGIASTTYKVDNGPETPYTDLGFALADGQYNIAATTTDNAGNSTTITFPVWVDSVAPGLTATATPSPAATHGYVNSDVTVTLTPTDDRSGVDRVAYTVNGAETTVSGDAPVTVPVTASGLTTITAQAYDVAGNVSPTRTVTVRIDRDGPVFDSVIVTPTATASGWVKGAPTAATAALSAIDGQSGVARIDYQLNGGAVTTYAGAITLVDGPNIITATAYDQLGNTGALEPTTVWVDSTAPVITASLPAVASVGQQAMLVYSCADTQSGLDATTVPLPEQLTSCQVKIDGAALAPDNAPAPVLGADGQPTGEWQVTIPAGSSTGTRTVTITATDNVGFVTTVTKTLRVGWRVCPLYDVASEKNIGSNYTIKIQLCDQTGEVVKLPNSTKVTALTIDGTIDPGPTFSGNSNDGYEFRLTRGESSYTYNLNTTGLPAGIHQLYFTTLPVNCPPPTPLLPRGCSLADLQALATNSAEFRLK